jgi:hypothetical protein
MPFDQEAAVRLTGQEMQALRTNLGQIQAMLDQALAMTDPGSAQ